MAKGQRKIPEMSDELRSMFNATSQRLKSRSVPNQTIYWYHDGLLETNESFRQKRLLHKANRWLAKSGFFQKPEVSEEEYVVDAFSITASGGLRPTWQGRA